MDLRNQRRRISLEELYNFPFGPHEGLGELGKRRIAHYDQQADPVSLDRIQFVGFVPNAPIVGHRDPSLVSDFCQPLFIRAVRREMIAVAMNAQASSRQDVRELVAQVAVCEIDNTQAARSYNTACSISSSLRS